MNEQDHSNPGARLPFFVSRLPALVLLLGSFACASGYHPVGALGDGYSEQKLASDRWLVTYATGSFAKPAVIARHLLHRAAEISVANDARYFAVLSGAKGDFIAARTQENLIENPSWAESVVADSMESESQARSGYARIVIQLFKDRRPTGLPDVYEAREVLDKIGSEGGGKHHD